MPHAVVVGAGLGGLGAGIHLRRLGWDVTLLERNVRPGGRMNQIAEEGFRMDTGPTLLMMPDVIESLFRDCGRDHRDFLSLERLDPSYQIRFGDGSRLTVGREAHTKEEIRRLAPREAERFSALMADMRRRYRIARGSFIERPFSNLGDLLHPRTLGALAGCLPIGSCWNHISRYFRDERLRQAFTFQTMYLGTSPYECPDIYSFLPFIEMEFGVWFPRGGMYAVADSLRRLYTEMGGSLECGVKVEQIEVQNGTATGVVLGDGRRLSADAVVSNCDAQTTYQQLIPKMHRRVYSDRRIRRLRTGCSGYLLYLGVRRVPDDWGHHTVLLPGDYAGVMGDLFQRGSLPRTPALYTCVPTRTDPTLAPPDHHVLYVLAPVPHLEGGVDWEQEGDGFRERCLDAVEAGGWPGVRDDIVFERRWAPVDFQRSYGLFRGSAFGLAHTFFQSSYFRPHNRSEDVRGLYLVGASTHPGGGVPIVLTSARFTADTLHQDFQRASGRSSAWSAGLPGTWKPGVKLKRPGESVHEGSR